jgi:hypothetical protein
MASSAKPGILFGLPLSIVNAGVTSRCFDFPLRPAMSVHVLLLARFVRVPIPIPNFRRSDKHRRSESGQAWLGVELAGYLTDTRSEVPGVLIRTEGFR